MPMKKKKPKKTEPALRKPKQSETLPPQISDEIIAQALTEAHGNLTAAARKLGKSTNWVSTRVANSEMLDALVKMWMEEIIESAERTVYTVNAVCGKLAQQMVNNILKNEKLKTPLPYLLTPGELALWKEVKSYPLFTLRTKGGWKEANKEADKPQDTATAESEDKAIIDAFFTTYQTAPKYNA